jgi:GTP-binding protein
MRIFELIGEVHDQANRRIPTSELNDKIGGVLAANPPPRHRNRPNKIFYFTQTAVKPPTFVFFIREPRGLHFSYERFLTNQIRETFGFDKVPLRLIFRKKVR